MLYDAASYAVTPLLDAATQPVVRTGFVIASVFRRLWSAVGALGNTIVHLEGAALDAFNRDAPHLVRCRWGEDDSGLVTPSSSRRRLTCATTPAKTKGAYRLYVSLNGIQPFEDTGLDFVTTTTRPRRHTLSRRLAGPTRAARP